MKKTFPLGSILFATSVSMAASYEVASEESLRGLSACASADTIMLVGSIEMSNTKFSPMCTGGFKGVFDGNGYSISNLHITESMKSMHSIAFIAVLDEGGVLKNLTFDTPVIVANQQGQGGVTQASVAVAVARLNGGSVENVHVINGTVDVKEGNHATGIDAGGLAGTAESGSISESGGNIDVVHEGHGSVVVGGICGNVTGDVTISSISYEGSNIPIAGAGMENVTSATKYGAVTINEKGSVRSAVIDGDYTAADTVKITSDIAVSSVTLNRAFNVNTISTLYVPFEIDATKVNAKIYKFKTVMFSEEDNRWKFKVSYTTIIKPNTPYVVLPSESQVTFDIAGTETKSVAFNTTTAGEDAASDGWEFKGVYSYNKFETIDDDNPIYGFANQTCSGAKLGQFVQGTAGAWINPMRAYLVYHKGGALKSVNDRLGGLMTLPDELDIVVEDEMGIVVETGRLNTITGEVRMDRWYDLKGRKLNSKPSVKGTYYKNGKKVIIK